MRILIMGVQGQLGWALRQAFSREDLILKDLPEFDLTRAESESQIVVARPISVFGCRANRNE